MKKLKLISLLAAVVLSFAACDKIEADQNGNYVTFGGANGTWYDSQADIPYAQRAFLVKFTGVRCVNCPTADEAIHASMEKYGDNFIVAAVHANNNFGKPLGDDIDLRTEDGNVWFDYYASSLPLPAAMINFDESDIFTPTSGIDDRIDQVIGQAPKVNMKMTTTMSGDNQYTAEVHVGFEQTVTDALTLTLLVVEDKIYTTQERQGYGDVENYEQNHVLRDIITDPWGIDVDADGKAGTKRMIRLNFSLNTDSDPANCHLIALISDKATKHVLNSVQCDVQ